MPKLYNFTVSTILVLYCDVQIGEGGGGGGEHVYLQCRLSAYVSLGLL